MADRPPKPCKKHGCGKITREANGYCQDHQEHAAAVAKEQAQRGDQRRESASVRGYGWKWSKSRVRHLKRNPLCEGCQSSGRAVPATHVHHKDENQLNNGPENLMSLCFECHEKLHGRKRK